MPMDANTYSERRDALANILTRTCDVLQDVHDKNADMNLSFVGERLGEMRGLAKKVYEDNFSIPLVAKFQGGKSTSFNTMHGRPFPISPMGDGAIKTSSSVIRAWNVTDPAERKCVVTWRTDEDLAWLFQGLLEKHILKLAADRFAGKEFKKELKLGDPSDLALARKALKEEIAVYKNNMSDYNDDDRDTLAIAAAIITFHDHPEIVALHDRTEFKEDEMDSLLRFPPKYINRLLDFFDGKAVFNPTEMAFAFVAHVDAKVASDFLAKTGCAVTDCPGLSASGYDTRLAMEVIAKSDAVWYLLDGMAIGNAALADLAKAHQAAGHKIFFTLNMRSEVNPTRRHILDVILPNHVASINARGIPLMAKDIIPFHALLAYLAGLGPRILDGTASRGARHHVLKQAQDMGNEVSTPEAAWEELATDMLNRLKVDSRREFSAFENRLSPRGIEIVRKESGIDDIIAKLQNFVLFNRARAILIDKGAARALDAVDSGVERPLAQREADNRSRVEELNARYDVMKKKLNDFIERAQRENAILESSDPDRELAKDLIDTVVVKSIPDMAASAAPDIRKQIGVLNIIWDFIKNPLTRGVTENKIKNIIGQHFDTAYTSRYTGWFGHINSGSNLIFNKFTSNVDDRRKRILDDWNTISQQFPEMKNLPSPTVVIGAPGSSLKPDDISNNVLKTIGTMDTAFIGTCTGLGVGVGGGMAAAVAAAHVVAAGGWTSLWSLDFILPGLGSLIMLAGALFCIFLLPALTDEKLIEKIKNTIQEKAPEEIANRRAEFVEKFAEGLANLRKPYIAAFNLGLENMRKKLHEMRKTAMADLAKGEDVRKEFADRCHAIRENQIVPLREEIQAYIAKTEPLCNADNQQ